MTSSPTKSAADLTANPLVACPISVAPMMDWTDRHDRYFLRLISSQVRLYTEMVTTGAILNGDRLRLLGFDPAEQPVALQIGGADADQLARCASIGQQFGYDEINLNVGCPSDRVQAGCFGAALMAQPKTVAAGVRAMMSEVSIPITVKHRLGIDDRADWENVREFVEIVAEAGCRDFIVHARAAWLQGLSPKENRDVPPLRYELVYRLKQTFPELRITINGGITDLAQAAEHLAHVDGAMLGRTAYQSPYVLASVDAMFCGDQAQLRSRHQIVEQLLPYIEEQLSAGVPLHAMTRHILGLFNGCPGARAWRRHLSEMAVRPEANIEIVREALTLVRPPGDAVAA